MECCAACREPLDPNDRPPVWPCCLARGHSACYGAAEVCPACGAPARLGEADTLRLLQHRLGVVGGGGRRQRALRDARPQPASGDGRIRAIAGVGGERRGRGREGADAAHRARDAGPQSTDPGFTDLGPRPAIYVCGDGAGPAAARSAGARTLASA